MMRWDLSVFYESLNSPKIEEDIKTVKQKVSEHREYINNLPSDPKKQGQAIEHVLKEGIDIWMLFDRLFNFASLTVSTEAKNQQAITLIDRVQKIGTELTRPGVIFQKWLASIENIDEIISSNDFLNQHHFHLKEIVEGAKYRLSDDIEEVITKMAQTGSNSWSKLYNTLSATQLVEMEKDGKMEKIPLPIVRNMAYEKDQNVRKNAYEAELKSYSQVDESLASAINSIKGEVIEVCKMRGFKSPLEQTLFNSRLSKEALDAMLGAIKDSLPTFRKYLKKKAEGLGHSNGLPFYDLFAPQGDIDLKFTYDETREFIVSNFANFSSELADFANQAFENNWIDAEPRDGKRGGGFCSSSISTRQSRILTNFTGVFSDVGTLAHELGHAYHNKCLHKETALNTEYTMPIAETASIFCESIINDAFINKASEAEKKSIFASNLDDAIQCIVDIYSRYLFETTVFEKRADSTMSVEDLKNAMLEAQKNAYGDGLDQNTLHPYMWACKPHYYYGSQNFYNFPYAFGLLFSKGLYSIYLKEGESFVEKYKKLLSITGKNKIADVTQSVGIDITKKEFWASSLKLIENDIEAFIKL